MNRQQKELVIQELKQDFSQSNGAFLVGVKGLTVTQLQRLRKDLRQQDGKLKITKARLMRIATNDADKQHVLDTYFKDQIGVVFAYKEAPAVAKVLFNFAKTNEKLRLVAGEVEAQLLDASGVTRIAMLPSKEVLLAMLCSVVQAPLSSLVRVIQAIADKKMQPSSESSQAVQESVAAAE